MNILAGLFDGIGGATAISPFFGIAAMAALIAWTPLGDIFPTTIRQNAKGIALIVAIVSFLLGIFTL